MTVGPPSALDKVVPAGGEKGEYGGEEGAKTDKEKGIGGGDSTSAASKDGAETQPGASSPSQGGAGLEGKDKVDDGGGADSDSASAPPAVAHTGPKAC